MNLSNYPLIKILFPYILGVFLAYFDVFPPKMYFLYFFLTILFLLFSMFLLPIKRYKWQWFKSLLIVFSFIFAGVFTTNFRLSPRLTAEQQREMTENADWVVRIVDFPVERNKSMKTKVEVLQTTAGRKMRGNVLLYFQKNAESQSLRYGDVLAVHTNMAEIEPPKNPDAFDNQKYMRRKGIFYTGYVSGQCWQYVEHRVPNKLKAFSKDMQQRMTDIFSKSGLTGREYDIICAILLGDDDTMEPELKSAYAAAGVSHILCVSGMHVGIIFMILNFLLKPLDLFRTTRVVKALLLLSSIWLYANITGLSPSVTRSATMFTFVTVGSLLQRNTNIFHSLLASLFILLVANPLLLFEVGFQLSYLAVFGIVLFQPMIVDLYHCKTKIGNYFWELLSVSVSAQLSTFPISIYYFGQFPNYFILSNLSVIALSFVVMITGVVLLAVSWIPIITGWVSFLLTWEIRVMNAIISFIENLPYSVTQNIDYSAVQVFFLYATILFAFLAIRHHRKWMGWFSYACFTLFSGCFMVRKLEIIHQEEINVYAIRNVRALDFCSQQVAVMFSDSIQNTENQFFQYSVKNHAKKQHAERTFISIDTLSYVGTDLCKQGDFIQFKNQTLYLLKRKETLFPMAKPMQIDVLVLQNNPVQKPEEVVKALNFQRVVADETVSPFYRERWRSWCCENGVEFQ